MQFVSIAARRRKWIASSAGAVLATLAITACGGSSRSAYTSTVSNTADSTSARTLLNQTFGQPHKVGSGVVDFNLTVVPHGSSMISGNIVLSVSGPFQSNGPGKLPDSDFTLSASAEGLKRTVELISVGGRGYVKLDGVAYQLPASALKQEASSLSSISGMGGGKGQSATSDFKKLGIAPLGWLSGATVVGQGQIGGEQTTHVHANVNVRVMLHDFSKLLGDAGSLKVGNRANVPDSIPAGTQQQISKALGKPSFDLWTGTTDKIIRKLNIRASIPVTGSISSQLGGLRSAALSLTFQYRDLNQPQTVQAPTNVKPFSNLRTKLSTLLPSLEQGLGAGITGAPTGTSTGASSSVK